MLLLLLCLGRVLRISQLTRLYNMYIKRNRAVSYTYYSSVYLDISMYYLSYIHRNRCTGVRTCEQPRGNYPRESCRPALPSPLTLDSLSKTALRLTRFSPAAYTTGPETDHEPSPRPLYTCACMQGLQEKGKIEKLLKKLPKNVLKRFFFIENVESAALCSL